MRQLLCLILVMLLGWSCAPTRYAVPLEKGEQRIGLSFGGPLIKFAGVYMPIPYSSLSYAQGMDEKNTLGVAFHTTASAFGVMHLELNWIHGWREATESSLGYSTALSLNNFFDLNEERFLVYPQLDINAWKNIGSRDNKLYFGLMNWFSTSQAENVEQAATSIWLPAVQVGVEFHKEKWVTSLEGKYFAPWRKSNNLPVDYQGIAGYGVPGIYVNLARRL